MFRRLFLIGLLLVVACEKQSEPEAVRPVKAIQVQASAQGENQIIFPGTLRAFMRADLSFRIDGIVIARDITVGKMVKKGDVLIQLDPREYEIALNKANGQAASIQAQLDFAGRDYERMKNIRDKDPGAISENLVDRKKENINQLTGDLAVAKSDVEKAADNLSYTLLRAPFDGIIAAIYVENHEQVRAKQAAVRVIDTAEREMEIAVPEKIITTLIEGTSLHFDVFLDAFPDVVFPAAIKEISTEASSTTQTYPVILTLKQIPAELSLLAGMSGRAILKQPKGNEGSSASTIKVPNSAIFTDNLNHTYVWVIDPKSHTVHKKPVKIDEANKGDFAIILEGLAPGEWVVTAGSSFLSEGQQVKMAEERTKP